MSVSTGAYRGQLVDRMADATARSTIAQEAASLPSIELDERSAADFELLVTGGYSPLAGFMNEEAYRSVLEARSLPGALPWPFPITLAATPRVASALGPGARASLRDDFGFVLGVVDIDDAYPRQPDLEAAAGITLDDALANDATLVGGTVTALNLPGHETFEDFRFSPARLRDQFAERQWKTVAAFHTSEFIDRRDEQRIASALDSVDGVLIHASISDEVPGPISAQALVESYHALVEHYLPAGRVQLAILPPLAAAPGPRAALLRAILARNFGCTHLIPSPGLLEAAGDLDLTATEIEVANIPVSDGASHPSKSELVAMFEAGSVPPGDAVRPEVAEILARGVRPRG